MNVARVVGPSEFQSLARLLNGYRVRPVHEDEHAWSIRSVTLEPNGRLGVGVEGVGRRCLSIELPPDFDPQDNEHRAWLLGVVERALLDPPRERRAHRE